MKATGRDGWTRLKTALALAAFLSSLMSGESVSAQAAAQTAAQQRAVRQPDFAARTDSRPRAVQTVEAADTALSTPSGVAYDSSGNLYIADTGDHCIREVTPLGVITTVAGSGVQGFGGDGGPATSAMLDSPAGVAVDASGNLYIADSHNQRIREVTAGTITTIAGTGTAGFSGDGGAATAATLNLPTALAVDAAGNVYVSDTNNHRIRRISGATITTVAGNGNQMYSGDGAPATEAGLDSPTGVAVDAAGNLYLGDTHNQRVRMVAAASGVISTLAGNGATGFSGDGSAGASASLARPRGVAFSTGNLYIADSDNNRVRAVNPAGTISTIGGGGNQGFSGDTGPATSAIFNIPRSVAVNQANTVGVAVGVADTENQRVREIEMLNSETLAGVGNPGSMALLLSAPTQVVAGQGAMTATLSHGASGATGTVTFLDVTHGVAALGTAPLANNSGTFSLAGVSAGTHLLAAQFQSDADVPVVTSGIVGVEVISGDFALSVAPSGATVLPGDAAKFAVTLTAAGGSFGSTVVLTASGLPEGATATFTPASVPAGAPGTATSALTIQTAGLHARQDAMPRPFRLPLSLGLLLLPICVNRRWRKGVGGRRAGVSFRLLAPCLLLLGAFSLSGCGSGINPNAPPPRSYTVTVTGTAAAVGPGPAITHSTTISLTIE